MGAAQTLADVAAAYLLNARPAPTSRDSSERPTRWRCTTR